ncbi:MAG: pseudouridine synthase [Candidatus Bipolaricaulota bacterium]
MIFRLRVMRLNKYLRDAGVAARRKADQLIQEGRVQVSGRTVREPWLQVNPKRDTVTVDGRPVRLRHSRHYLKLYKPRGVTSTLADPHAEQTLSRYLPSGLRLVPVGRLDRESEGLVLLTDDGELINRLTHPRFGVPKRYQVMLTRSPSREELARLREGVELEDGPFQPTQVRRTGDQELELTLHEGRKREIRRGFAALDHEVSRLVRLSIGPVELGVLTPGEMAPLSARELQALGVNPTS